VRNAIGACSTKVFSVTTISAGRKSPERLLLDSRRSDLTGKQRDELFVFLDESVSGGLRLAIFGRMRGFELLKPEFPLSVRGFE
jgi:hypothetical protein